MKKKISAASALFNQPDILLKHCVKEVHVVALSLDCVREETESLVP